MHISRINTYSNKTSFGATFSEKVESEVESGRDRYRYNYDALVYYNKKVSEARELSPEFSVTSKNVDANMINPYGRDIIILKKGTTFVRKPIVDLPLRMNNLELTDLQTLDGITRLCECLKMAPKRIYYKGMEKYFETKPSKEIQKLLDDMTKTEL